MKDKLTSLLSIYLLSDSFACRISSKSYAISLLKNNKNIFITKFLNPKISYNWSACPSQRVSLHFVIKLVKDIYALWFIALLISSYFSEDSLKFVLLGEQLI